MLHLKREKSTKHRNYLLASCFGVALLITNTTCNMITFSSNIFFLEMAGLGSFALLLLLVYGLPFFFSTLEGAIERYFWSL